jgi:DNA-binding FrmR family transcriptional regulator|tara:strand:+ start:511 stop:792 length:282 start_codon:yes stop_codon:yes gene_type:complete
MVQYPRHESSLIALRRIEGQIRGIQKMIDGNKYCVDIVNQVHASINALYRVAEKILAKHMEHCVADAMKSGSELQKSKKIKEIMGVVRRLNKL